MAPRLEATRSAPALGQFAAPAPGPTRSVGSANAQLAREAFDATAIHCTHTHTHKQHFRLLRRGIFARRVALHGHNRARPRRRASASTACHETTSAKCLNTQRQRPLAPEQPSGPVSPDVAPCQRPNSRREPRPRGEPSQHTASHASLVAAVTLLETGCE